MGKITREWRMMGDDQEADSTMRGEGRQCETIDAIAYDDDCLRHCTTFMRLHAVRMQGTLFSSPNNGTSMTPFVAPLQDK